MGTKVQRHNVDYVMNNLIDVFTFAHQGVLTTGAGTMRLYVPYSGTILLARCSLDTAPTGSTRIDVNRSGTSLWSTDGAKPTFASGNNTVSAVPNQNTTVTAGTHYLTVDIDTLVGSPANLVVAISIRRDPV